MLARGGLRRQVWFGGEEGREGGRRSCGANADADADAGVGWRRDGDEGVRVGREDGHGGRGGRRGMPGGRSAAQATASVFVSKAAAGERAGRSRGCI